MRRSLSSMAWAGFKPARKGVALRHLPLRWKPYNFLAQKFPSPGGVPVRAGWSRGRVGQITCPPGRNSIADNHPGALRHPSTGGEYFLSVNCRFQRTVIRNCGNVRAKQLGEGAIRKKDAPCFDIISQ
jgi:hypothetical protein